MKLLSPPLLKVNDTVGFISPSAGLAGIFKHRAEQALRWFERNGFKVKTGKNFWKSGYIAGEPKERSNDLNKMIYDKEIKAIICAIGGDHSVQLLKYIDFKAFRRNPKIFVGFSDITVLHLAFYKTSKVQTFYGPMVLTQFGEYPKPFDYTIEYFFRVVMKRDNLIKIKPVDYTDQFLDWGKYKKAAKIKFKGNKFLWLRKGEGKGKLLGGCLPSILRIAGTKYFPSFKNSIIFLETPEGEDPRKPYKIEKVDADLSQLIEIGIFDKARGLILGIPYKYTEKMKKKLYQLIVRRLKDYDFPILANANFGHTNPIITIPYGSIGILNSWENSFLLQMI